MEGLQNPIAEFRNSFQVDSINIDLNYIDDIILNEFDIAELQLFLRNFSDDSLEELASDEKNAGETQLDNQNSVNAPLCNYINHELNSMQQQEMVIHDISSCKLIDSSLINSEKKTKEMNEQIFKKASRCLKAAATKRKNKQKSQQLLMKKKSTLSFGSTMSNDPKPNELGL